MKEELKQTQLRIAGSINDLFDIELQRVHQTKNPKSTYRLIALGFICLGYSIIAKSDQDSER